MSRMGNINVEISNEEETESGIKIIKSGIVTYDTLMFGAQAGGSSSSSDPFQKTYVPTWKALCTLGDGTPQGFSKALNYVKIANALFKNTSRDGGTPNDSVLAKGRAIPVQLKMLESGQFNIDVMAIIDLTNTYDWTGNTARGVLQIHYMIIDPS